MELGLDSGDFPVDALFICPELAGQICTKDLQRSMAEIYRRQQSRDHRLLMQAFSSHAPSQRITSHGREVFLVIR